MQLVFSFPNNLILKENDGGDKGKQENPNAASRQGPKGRAYLWRPALSPSPPWTPFWGLPLTPPLFMQTFSQKGL